MATIGMKTITTILLILTLNLVYGQDTLQFDVATPNGFKGQITDTRTIVYSGKLDLDFYKKHFFTPYHYPQKMVDTNHKNDTITKWNDSTKVGDFNTNWSYTITYDSLSRVTSYRYSACMICSQLPYEFHFIYNQLGQVIKMINKLNDKKTIEFKYDPAGNIVNVKEYHGSDLTKEIELINKK
ncbi:hypothetical protein [Croceimicrobium hydrocarbonivorans]|uniref:YD repeat-containing protein n=1 Tax=Croceimicrobium hydrocarbonivorans TaxID=2761580 RepID=A0A7H0VFM7_9FLAO|nr:hypothetical protein [Croceimicrobium hydrocarbonivorans]QNR24525.1 hypothetical protein H4K34_01395 [Croceimicrobium hydrocarbonivorans]